MDLSVSVNEARLRFSPNMKPPFTSALAETAFIFNLNFGSYVVPLSKAKKLTAILHSHESPLSDVWSFFCLVALLEVRLFGLVEDVKEGSGSITSFP
jgi:hypothetical protein